MKKHFISIYKDYKTGVGCIFFLTIGIILLLIVGIINLTSVNFLSESQKGSIIAFSIIFIFVGFIFYFFKYQFAKLAEIANEIENIEEE